MTFDERVAVLRGKVVPKNSNKKKADCTPEEYAAHVDYMKAWKSANPEKRRAANRKSLRKWKSANPDKVREDYKKWASLHPDRVKELNRKATRNYRLNNPESRRRWVSNNRDNVRQRARQYTKNRRKNDPLYRMMYNLRSRQRKFFKGKGRSLSMVRDMGCTQEFFRQHIESQFTAGMTMENYGTAWHLDHIYPLSRADIVDNPIHFLAAANWRNIQPMLGPENLKKSDAVTPEAQALFDLLVQEFSRKELT